jgi:hypothetical protein
MPDQDVPEHDPVRAAAGDDFGEPDGVAVYVAGEGPRLPWLAPRRTAVAQSLALGQDTRCVLRA